MTSFQALPVGKISPARLQTTLIDNKNLLKDVSRHSERGRCLVLYLFR